jgi:GAF domain-containing protein
LHAAFLQALDAQLRTLEDASHIQYVAATAIGQYLQADRVGYAEDEGDGQHITVTRNFTRGVPGIEGRYAYDVYGEELLRNFVQGKSVVRNDLEHDPQLTNAQKHAHAQLQLGATVNVPLLKHNKLVAVMFMHQRHARNWQLHEVELLQAVAHRTWEAVQRTRTQQALAASQALINTLIAHLPGGAVFVVDLNLRYILARGEALAHAHFTPQDFEGKTLHEALPTKLATEYGRIYRKNPARRDHRVRTPRPSAQLRDTRRTPAQC